MSTCRMRRTIRPMWTATGALQAADTVKCIRTAKVRVPLTATYTPGESYRWAGGLLSPPYATLAR
eukprot:7206675-Prymnesium_polylepis.1